MCESFHQHLNQLIPGVPTCSTFFQIYLLDGLERWNETAATSSFLQHAVNLLGKEVFQQNLLSTTITTGELIGLEYLFLQNGNAFQDRNFIIRQIETTDIQMAKTEGYSEQEDVWDWTITQQSAPSLFEDSPSMVSRGSQSQVEDLFAPSTSSPENEMMAPEKVVSIKEESMECNCHDKPLISNLPPDTVMENSNTTQEQALPVQPAPAETQSGSSLTFPLLLSGPSLSNQMMMVLISHLKSDAPPTASCHSVPVPYTTRYYWKKKLVKEKDGIYTRKYVRRSDAIQCRKCNKERIRSTHWQYYGNWYCRETETKQFTVWKDELLKRGYGRKKF